MNLESRYQTIDWNIVVTGVQDWLDNLALEWLKMIRTWGWWVHITHAGHLIAFNKTVLHAAVSQQRDGTARLSRRDVMHFVNLLPWPLTFWPNVNWSARYRDGLAYPCAKFGDFSFNRFDFIVETDRITHRHTESQDHRITDADDRYTHYLRDYRRFE